MLGVLELQTRVGHKKMPPVSEQEPAGRGPQCLGVRRPGANAVDAGSTGTLRPGQLGYRTVSEVAFEVAWLPVGVPVSIVDSHGYRAAEADGGDAGHAAPGRPG